MFVLQTNDFTGLLMHPAHTEVGLNYNRKTTKNRVESSQVEYVLVEKRHKRSCSTSMCHVLTKYSEIEDFHSVC